MLLCEYMFLLLCVHSPGLLWDGSSLFRSGEKRALCAINTCLILLVFPSEKPGLKPSALAQTHWGKSLVTAEPAVMLMALIYTQEDLEPLDLL